MPTPTFPLYRYPEDVGTPPFDKWIRFDAKAMRHVFRNKNIGEQNEADVTLASVVLYLHESTLKSTLMVNWEPHGFGSVAGAMLQAASNGRSAGSVLNNGGLPGVIIDEMKSAAGKVKEALSSWQNAKSALADAFSTIYGMFTAEGAAHFGEQAKFGEALAGQRVNPRTEILFDSQQYRAYNFEFMLVPRSLKEAQAIDNIIRFFQFYMLPKYMEGDTLMGYPFEFQVGIYSSADWGSQTTTAQDYRKQIKTIQHIGRSIVKNVGVDHAAGGKTAFVKDNGELFPVATQLSLELQEVKLLDRTDSEIRRGLSEAEMSAAFPDPRKAN